MKITNEDYQRYAGFWLRVLAFAWDYGIIAAYLVIVFLASFAVRAVFPGFMQTLLATPWSGELSAFVLVTLPISLYFALSEAGPRSATWGKRRTRLMVFGPGRQPIGLRRSLGRTALKFIPWELAHFTIWQYSFLQGINSPFLDACLILVWVLVGANAASLLLSPTRQTLYDRLAQTHVVHAI